MLPDTRPVSTQRTERSRAEWQADTLEDAALMPVDAVRVRLTGPGVDIRSTVRSLKEYGEFRAFTAYPGISKNTLAIPIQILNLPGVDHPDDADGWWRQRKERRK